MVHATLTVMCTFEIILQRSCSYIFSSIEALYNLFYQISLTYFEVTATGLTNRELMKGNTDT